MEKESSLASLFDLEDDGETNLEGRLVLSDGPPKKKMCSGTERAIKQVRHASKSLDKTDEWITSNAQASRLLTVFANSMEFFGTANRPQVESALADYFDSLEV